jgi:hypothetical protein
VVKGGQVFSAVNAIPKPQALQICGPRLLEAEAQAPMIFLTSDLGRLTEKH